MQAISADVYGSRLGVDSLGNLLLRQFTWLLVWPLGTRCELPASMANVFLLLIFRRTQANIWFALLIAQLQQKQALYRKHQVVC